MSLLPLLSYPRLPELDTTPDPLVATDYPTIRDTGKSWTYDENRPMPSYTKTYPTTADRAGMTVETMVNPNTMMPFETAPTPPALLSQIRPISQTLSEKVQAQGAYRDIPSYMADVRNETYKLAALNGIDLKSQEGQQWINQTLQDAKAAAMDYIRPPMEKGQFIETPYGMFDAVDRKFVAFPGMEQLNTPTIPETPHESPIDADISRARRDAIFATTPAGKAALAEADRRAKEKESQDANSFREKSEKRAEEKFHQESKLPQGLSTRLSDAKSALDMVKELDPIIKNGIDIGGPAWGQISKRNPWDNDTQSFQADLDLTKQIVGKYLEGGVLRAEDEKKYANILPKITDTIDVRSAKTKKLTKKLQDKFNTDLDVFEAAGYNMKPMREFLSKDKVLTREIAAEYKKKANGNIEEAKKLAAADGYTEK